MNYNYHLKLVNHKKDNHFFYNNANILKINLIIYSITYIFIYNKNKIIFYFFFQSLLTNDNTFQKKTLLLLTKSIFLK